MALARTTVVQVLCTCVFFVLFVLFVQFGPTPFHPDPYPYQPTYKGYTDKSAVYRLALISDLDKASRFNGSWRSFAMTGTLLRAGGSYDFLRDRVFEVTTTLNENGRGMELSELVQFGGDLLAFDDRSGIAFAIDTANKKAYPRFVLPEGDGNQQKGMKVEWATVVDNHLFVGSIGKEFTTPTGKFLHDRPFFVKVVGPNGTVESVDWKHIYMRVRGALGITAPGYAIHEAVAFAPRSRTWVFAPRKCSKETYDDKLDEQRACPQFVLTRDFESFTVIKDPQFNMSRGFSSIKFFPGDESKLIYLKSVEVDDRVESYIGMVSTTGKTLMRERFIAAEKYEGVEFV